jgi:hypothetical protein
MQSPGTGGTGKSTRKVPYRLLLEANRQLMMEKVELTEEVRQLKAAVEIYREVVRRNGWDPASEEAPGLDG